MYLVKKHRTTKVVSQEFWIDELKAEIRRDIINTQSDEYSGATIEVATVGDLHHSVKSPNEWEIDWKDKTSLSGISMIFYLSQEARIKFELEVDLNINFNSDIKFDIGIANLIYQHQTEQEFQFELIPTTLAKFTKLVFDYMDTHDYFSDYESDEVSQANRN